MRLLSNLAHFIQGVLAALLFALNTIVMCTVLWVFAIFKFLLPDGPLRQRLRHGLTKLAETWISFNNFGLSLDPGLEWRVHVPENLDPKGCYLVNSNHQTWVDIPVLQYALNRRAPFMRFFLKKQLIWVPFLGPAWWALDMPFMERHSREEIARNPALKGRDLESARRACEKLEGIPASVMNFLEGTRFSEAKRAAGEGRWKHLLKPRIGGIGQVLYSLGDRLDAMLDVTIVYPAGAPSLWQLLSGRVPRIDVHVREVPIPASLFGRQAHAEPALRAELADWVNALWDEKDAMIEATLQAR